MKESLPRAPAPCSASNPFSTRYVRPGAMEYLFPIGETAAQLVERLAAHHWRGQIVGPHGCGKSTLVASLLPALDQAGRPACVVALRDGQRRLPRDWMLRVRGCCARLLVVDGYEQLSVLSRWLLRLRCRAAGLGLLVTAHQDVGLPTLLAIEPRLTVAQIVVDRLLPAGQDAIDAHDVAECFAAAGGNLRETLFALYDRYGRTAARRAC